MPVPIGRNVSVCLFFSNLQTVFPNTVTVKLKPETTTMKAPSLRLYFETLLSLPVSGT